MFELAVTVLLAMAAFPLLVVAAAVGVGLWIVCQMFEVVWGLFWGIFGAVFCLVALSVLAVGCGLATLAVL